MPELPEVETIVRHLASGLPGHRIREVRVHQADLLDTPPDGFCGDVAGQEILAVSRRGKNIVLSLSRPQFLVVNLGMTGRLLFFPGTEGGSPPSHPGLDFLLEPTGTLVYTDIRRFGRLRLLSPGAWKEESARLGPEPLQKGLSDSTFHQALQRSRSPIRSWLLDQRNIAGVGNIYASEALFRGGIHPRRPADTLSFQEGKALLAGLRAVLRQAVQARGTTLRDYRTATGEEGNFAEALRVYGRNGQPCLRCKTPVERIVLGNRSAFFCSRCQPEAP